MSLIPALGRKRQVDLCKFKASLVYRVSSRTATTIPQRNPVSEKQRKKSEVWATDHSKSSRLPSKKLRVRSGMLLHELFIDVPKIPKITQAIVIVLLPTRTL